MARPTPDGTTNRHRTAFAPALLAAATAVLATLTSAPALAAGPTDQPARQPVARGHGGAVSTVDPYATEVGLRVLERGGNAVDAAVAAAATLGVTEPFSAGIGGGGFLLYYDAGTRTVHTIDGRESAPAATRPDRFVDPATGAAYEFAEARVSGLSVGVPGTPATWADAVRRWGTRSLADLLRPAAAVADSGFVVDETFRAQVADNAAAFGQFPATSALYLPGGAPPEVGTVLRNPDLARTYRLLARRGVDAFYTGAVARDIVDTVRRPSVAADPVGDWAYPVRPGDMTRADLAGYRVRTPAPTRSDYRGLTVYGMSTPSSGGVVVGEALNILERFDLSAADSTGALHRYLEASALAFADRNRYVGQDTPPDLLAELLDDDFAAQRACLIDPARALPKPAAPGVPDGSYGTGCPSAAPGTPANPEHGTTNLTVADRWGNIVEYNLTIEQIGGSAMVVPGRGFLLNNELTDFNFTPTQGSAPDPNLPGPDRRPRSSMSPTIVLADGRPLLALGSPGGSTIITTVLQILLGRIDLDMSLPQALTAPRATGRNTAAVQAEPEFLATPEAAALTALGHEFASTPEIGAATAIEFGRDGSLTAVAEPTRRGGGAAAVVHPLPD